MANEQLSAEQIADMQQELSALKEENQILRKEKIKGEDHTGVIVKGRFTATLETTAGKKVKKTVQFNPGYVKCRLKNGEKVWSEDLMSLANLKAKEDLSAEALKRSPHLASLSNEAAAEWLTELIKRGVTFLREVQ